MWNKKTHCGTYGFGIALEVDSRLEVFIDNPSVCTVDLGSTQLVCRAGRLTTLMWFSLLGPSKPDCFTFCNIARHRLSLLCYHWNWIDSLAPISWSFIATLLPNPSTDINGKYVHRVAGELWIGKSVEGGGHGQNQVFCRRSYLEGLCSTVNPDGWPMFPFFKVIVDLDTLPVRW